MNEVTHKQNVHGIFPGLSQDCLGIFLREPGNFVYVFPFFPQEKFCSATTQAHCIFGNCFELLVTSFRSLGSTPISKIKGSSRSENDSWSNFRNSGVYAQLLGIALATYAMQRPILRAILGVAVGIGRKPTFQTRFSEFFVECWGCPPPPPTRTHTHTRAIIVAWSGGNFETWKIKSYFS